MRLRARLPVHNTPDCCWPAIALHAPRACKIQLPSTLWIRLRAHVKDDLRRGAAAYGGGASDYGWDHGDVDEDDEEDYTLVIPAIVVVEEIFEVGAMLRGVRTGAPLHVMSHTKLWVSRNRVLLLQCTCPTRASVLSHVQPVLSGVVDILRTLLEWEGGSVNWGERARACYLDKGSGCRVWIEKPEHGVLCFPCSPRPSSGSKRPLAHAFPPSTSDHSAQSWPQVASAHHPTSSCACAMRSQPRCPAATTSLSGRTQALRCSRVSGWRVYPSQGGLQRQPHGSVCVAIKRPLEQTYAWPLCTLWLRHPRRRRPLGRQPPPGGGPHLTAGLRHRHLFTIPAWHAWRHLRR